MLKKDSKMIQLVAQLVVKLASNKPVEVAIITAAVVSVVMVVAHNVKCSLQSAQVAVYKQKFLSNLLVKNLCIVAIASNPCAVTRRKLTKGLGGNPLAFFDVSENISFWKKSY
jgi:hypothetical protein